MQQSGGSQANVASSGAPAGPDAASPGATGATGTASGTKTTVNGGRFDFDDGGTYCGGWEDGKAHGHGVCTGPKGQGAYAGSWHYGFEVSGIYTWPSGSAFEGQWQNGKRHGLGVETRGRWLYRGEWTQGFKGRYGVRQSSTSNARYEGTWANGLQDGYGSETYADGGTFQGQWLRGMRHGYGVRASAPFGMASHYRPNKNVRASMTSLRSTEAGAPGAATPDPAAERDKRIDDSRGGFVLKARSDDVPAKPRRGSLVEKSSGIKKSILSGLKIRKQRSTGDLEKRGTSASMRSTGSTASWISNESSQSVMTNASVHTDSNASFIVEDGEQMDPSVVETYFGEWKNDKRAGFGISERSDGLKYEGEWFANKKYGYGVTTFKDGAKEEGKYKNNVLITSQKKKHLFLIRSAKFRERIDAAVSAANRASKIALQKADIAISRTATARGKGESADMAADHAREDSDVARSTAKQFAPDFQQPGLDRPRGRDMPKYRPPPEDALPGKSILHQSSTPQQQKTSANDPASSQQQNQQQYQQNQPQYPPSQSQYSNQPQYSSNNQSSQSQSQYQSNQTQNQYQPTSQPQFQPKHQPSIHPQHNPATSAPLPNDDKPYLNRASSIDQLQHGRGSNQLPPTTTSSSPTTMPSSAYNDDSSAGANNVQRLPGSTLRRDSRVKAMESPAYSYQQSLNDRFDQYKRPPSRDGSVDRFSRTGARPGPGSRQSSVDKTMPPPPMAREPSVDRTIRAGSNLRGQTPLRGTTPIPSTGNGSVVGAGAATAAPLGGYAVPSSVGEDFMMRRRNPTQDIIPSPGGQPKRTESLYITPVKGPPQKSLPAPVPIQRKKSLPDVQGLPKATDPMSREEVSVLSSARREEVRRMQDENERLRANPLLYLVSPHVKDWFSRQQLVMLVLFINISLAIMFFKLLT